MEFLYNFLIKNKGVGPYGKDITNNMTNLQIGDIAQISFDGIKYEHTTIIVKIENPTNIDKIYTASHTYDTFEKQLGSYQYSKIRFIKIQGVRN